MAWRRDPDGDLYLNIAVAAVLLLGLLEILVACDAV